MKFKKRGWKQLLAAALVCTMLASSSATSSLFVYAENAQAEEMILEAESDILMEDANNQPEERNSVAEDSTSQVDLNNAIENQKDTISTEANWEVSPDTTDVPVYNAEDNNITVSEEELISEDSIMSVLATDKLVTMEWNPTRTYREGDDAWTYTHNGSIAIKINFSGWEKGTIKLCYKEQENADENITVLSSYTLYEDSYDESDTEDFRKYFNNSGYYLCTVIVGGKQYQSDCLYYQRPEQSLEPVTNLKWVPDTNTGKIVEMTWDDVNNAQDYEVRLYKDNISYGSTIVYVNSISSAEREDYQNQGQWLLDLINGGNGGVYSFTVSPIVDTSSFGKIANGIESEKSKEIYVGEPLEDDTEVGPQNVVLGDEDGVLSFNYSSKEVDGTIYKFVINRDSKYIAVVQFACGKALQGKETSFSFASEFNVSGNYSGAYYVYRNNKLVKYGQIEGFDYTLAHNQMASPSNLRWEGKNVVWDAVPGAASYRIAVFRDGRQCGGYLPLEESAKKNDDSNRCSWDVSEVMKEKGTYTFWVKAVPSNIKDFYVSEAAYSKEYLTWEYVCDNSDGILYYNGNALNGLAKTASITVEQQGTNYKPIYTSSDTNVATVKADAANPNLAVITATGVGTATITISVNGNKKSFPITVENRIELEGITLNKTDITLNSGSSATLTVTPNPANYVLPKEDITWEVIDGASLVSITDCSEDKTTAVITANNGAGGNAKVRVSVNGTEPVECSVLVKSKRDLTAEIVAYKSQSPIVLLDLMEANASLKDVELPQIPVGYAGKWSWNAPEMILQADDQRPVQWFDATYKEEGYEDIVVALPVRISKLKAISIIGPDALRSHSAGNMYEVQYSYTGSQDASIVLSDLKDIFQVELDLSKAKYLERQKEYEYQNYIYLKSPDEISDQSFALTKQTVKAKLVNKNTSQIYSTEFTIMLLPEPAVDFIGLEDVSPDEDNIISISGNSIFTPVKHTFNVPMEGDGDCDLVINKSDITPGRHSIEVQVVPTYTVIEDGETYTYYSDANLKYVSSDTNVVEVKEGESFWRDTFIIKAKNSGTAEITITALDGGGYTRKIQVTIKDEEPILENTAFTLNRVKKEAVPLPIRTLHGTTISSVTVGDSRLSVQESDGEYYLGIKPSLTEEDIKALSSVKKIDTNLTITTDKAYTKVITVSLVNTLPTVIAKQQTKANVFFKDTASKWTITSTDKISSIVEKTEMPEVGFHLDTDATNLDTGEIQFKATGLTADTVKNINKKVTLLVYFENYTQPKEVTVTVGTENKKPALKIKDITLINQENEIVNPSAKVWFYENTKKEDFDLTGTTVVINPKDKTGVVIAQSETDKNDVTLTYKNLQTKSYKVDLSNANWTADLTVSGKVSVVKQKELVLGKNKVTLNKDTNVAENGTLEIPVSVKGSDTKVTKVTYKTDKNSAFLINENHLYVVYNAAEQKIKVGLNKSIKNSTKTGNYKIVIGATDNENQVLKPVTITVGLTDKAPVLSLKAKGFIDLLQRNNSSIVYTPTIANVESSISSVQLTGEYATYFDVNLTEAGAIEVAATDRDMSTSINYPVGMKVELENGMEVELSKPLKVKPMNKTPKIAASVTKATLYKGSEYKAPITLKLNAMAEIEKIELVEDKNSKFFELQANPETQELTLGLSSEQNGMKAGKYNVSYRVYFKGAAYNVKPTVVKCTVTVKNK